MAISNARLGANPPDAGVLDEDAIVDCRLVVKSMSGTTPKFYCDLPSGESIEPAIDTVKKVPQGSRRCTPSTGTCRR